jgi:hypothetical protein
MKIGAAILLTILLGFVVSGAAAANETNWTNSTRYWMWYSANVTPIANTSIQAINNTYQTYYVVAGGGGGASYLGGTGAVSTPTQASETNLTNLGAPVDPVNAFMELAIGAGKVVIIFGIMGIVLGVLYQNGALPGFQRGRREANRANEGGGEAQDQPEVQPIASEEPKPGKPEKRDRYEVIKV